MTTAMTNEASAAPRPNFSSRALLWAKARLMTIAWVLLVMMAKFVLPPAWAWPLSWIAIGLILLRMFRTLGRQQPPTTSLLLRHLCGAMILIVLTMPKQWRHTMMGSGWIALPVAIVALHILMGSLWGLRRARKTPGDFKLKAAVFLQFLLPERLAQFAATDVNLLTYVIPGLRRRDEPPGHLAFGYHRQIRPILVVFISLASLEAVVGHLMLIHANPVVRWVVFIISDLGLVYFIALAASLGKLPLLVGRDHIVVRAGIFIEMDIPIDAVASVDRFVGFGTQRRTGSLHATLMSAPSVYIEFNREIEVSIPVKGVRNVLRAGVRPDDPVAFIAAVEGALAGHRQQAGRPVDIPVIDRPADARPRPGWASRAATAAC